MLRMGEEEEEVEAGKQRKFSSEKKGKQTSRGDWRGNELNLKRL